MRVATQPGLGEAMMDRLAALARFTEEPGCLTRRYVSAAHRASAAALLSACLRLIN